MRKKDNENSGATVSSIALIVGITITITILATMTVTRNADNQKIYNQAEELYKLRNYELAADEFNKLGDWKDSNERKEEMEEYVTAYNYGVAIELFNEGNYKEALIMFEEVKHDDEYTEDCEEYIEQCWDLANIKSFKDAIAKSASILYVDYLDDYAAYVLDDGTTIHAEYTISEDNPYIDLTNCPDQPNNGVNSTQTEIAIYNSYNELVFAGNNKNFNAYEYYTSLPDNSEEKHLSMEGLTIYAFCMDNNNDYTNLYVIPCVRVNIEY